MPVSPTSVINFHKYTSNEKTLLDVSCSTFGKGTQSIKVTPPSKVTLFHVTRGKGIPRLRAYAKKIFWTTKSRNFCFFCTKEAITLWLPFIRRNCRQLSSHYSFCLLSKPTPTLFFLTNNIKIDGIPTKIK